MSFGAITPARIDFSDPASPSAPDFADVYHSRAGALAQARHVFLGGNNLPRRWSGRERFVVLETGFGLGNNFLATWAAWRDDPQRCDRLWFVSVEKHPPTRADLARAHSASELPALAAELVERWPVLTPDLHVIDFDQRRVRLLLALGDVAAVLRELVVQADAFYLDGFAQAHNPAMWQEGVFTSLKRLAAPDATAATWSVAHAVRRRLGEAGFEVTTAPGFGGKREMTVARFAPHHVAEAPPGRRSFCHPSGGRASSRARTVAIVGAGLAGAAAARALSAQGLRCAVIDHQADSANETSGNPGGLFHGIVNAADNPHARWLRAAALLTENCVRPLIQAGRVAGSCEGLLRLESRLPLAAMHETLARQGLPSDWLQAISADQAGVLSGLDAQIPSNHQSRLQGQAGTASRHPAWWYRRGGWLAPRDLVRVWLEDSAADCRFGHQVDRLLRDGNSWQLLDAQNRLITEADAVVLANSHDALRLLKSAGTAQGRSGDLPQIRREVISLEAAWPLISVRGQITRVAADSGMPAPKIAMADAGYWLTLADGSLLCGATSDIGDTEAALRDDDHRHNLAQLQRLAGLERAPGLEQVSTGRVGWRCLSADKLPLVGPVVDVGAAALRSRLDQPRFQPRIDGLYVLSALGSRGITQAALAGELLASWLTGAPMPLPACLIDALDNARFAARALRRNGDAGGDSIESD
jgi:tRNA 5-methylaminomethyl-2-thiouridine biosynthesis bifunctional protein